MDKQILRPVNWNAGGEYNEFIKTLKEEYLLAEIEQDYPRALNQLAIDFDFSHAKMLSQAQKIGYTKKIQKTAKIIRTLIAHARSYTKTHHNTQNYPYEMQTRLSRIRRLIWDSQGRYGILYPYEKEKGDPGEAIKRGFS